MTEPPAPWTPDRLLAYLDELGIATRTLQHPPVFTVEEAKRLRGPLPGGHCKSLFLRNKKGVMWLVVTMEHQKIDLRALADSLGAGRLSFGSPERLMRHLGVVPGAVTPLAVVNDGEHVVTVALDRAILEHDPLNFHPLDNAQTTAIGPDDLMRFLEATGHPPVLLTTDDLAGG